MACSLTRHQTHAPAVEAWSFNHWTSRDTPISFIILLVSSMRTRLDDYNDYPCFIKHINGDFCKLCKCEDRYNFFLDALLYFKNSILCS